jgi:L-fucose dehydrogenase
MTTLEEIADMVIFLLSSKSSQEMGQFIYVDGAYVHLDRSLYRFVENIYGTI